MTPSGIFHRPAARLIKTPSLASVADILAMFDANVTAARQALSKANDQMMTLPWTLKYQGEVIFTMPRSSVIRGFVLNHLIHHRAILCVNLRVKNIPVPGMYGPSGDE